MTSSSPSSRFWPTNRVPVARESEGGGRGEPRCAIYSPPAKASSLTDWREGWGGNRKVWLGDYLRNGGVVTRHTSFDSASIMNQPLITSVA